jgi:late-transcription coactivator
MSASDAKPASSQLVEQFANNTAKEIEDIVWDKDVSWLEATLLWCEKNGFDESELGEILKRHEPIRLKIQEDAENLHFLKREGRLPI